MRSERLKKTEKLIKSMMGSTKTTDPHVRTTNGYSILTTTTTYRSSSTSAMTSTRPQTLNVNNLREAPTLEAEYFISEALNAWRAKARCSVVPAERVQELFHELQFHPNERQISDMLQTAKKFARKGSREWNGLTFGEFCVLAADLKRFRTTNFTSTSKKTRGLCCQNVEVDSNHGLSYSPSTSAKNIEKSRRANSRSFKLPNERIKKSCSDTITSSFTSPSESGTPVEVFLGGSCNPTTWRKDVAIPALKKLGISFYNPQVSDWTPDLIELEHKAKEKARVLFFVMDSETRASAGAIEAAHIAGQNSKQLVLVLHPYRPDQYILNEPLSHQEFIDLTRNQQILRELVSRRGLPVLDSIPLGLQRTKEILAGITDPPPNIASILIVVRGAFDRVNRMHDTISLEQCQRALSILGYAQSFLTLENLKNVILSQKNILQSPCQQFAEKNAHNTLNSFQTKMPVRNQGHDILETKCQIDFDKFCILAAYLSVLQQEIHESGCISPIKGTNLPPPPVYLTNLQGFQTRHADDNITVNYSTKQIFQTSCNADVTTDDHLYDFVPDNRDSGTSSPQPIESLLGPSKLGQKSSQHCLKKSVIVEAATCSSVGNFGSNAAGEESDSNDSVFSSSGSSINSNCCSGDSAFSSFEIRDVYLGGSCYLRTKWRQDCAIPYLKSKNISFHLPALHESIQPSQFDLPEKSFEDSNSQGRKQNGLNFTDQLPYQKKHKNAKISHEESSYRPLNTRPNLYNPSLMDSSRVLLFIITNETRSLAPMTLAAHCIGLMYNVVLCVQMLPENCVIGSEKLTSAAIKDYNRGRSYLIDLAKRQGVPVFNDLKSSLECTVDKVKGLHSQKNYSAENVVVMKSGSAGVK